MREHSETTGRLFSRYIADVLFEVSDDGSLADLRQVISESNLPIIITVLDGRPIIWNRVPVDERTEEDFEMLITMDIENPPTPKLRRLIELYREFDRINPPIPIRVRGASSAGGYVHFGESPLQRELRLMPFVLLAVFLVFMGAAIQGLRYLKLSEQRSIWVGLAKETAHQLGTPISSLLGWLEMIKSEKNSDNANVRSEEADEALNNMMVDIKRLERIANRFGLIGSKPELVPQDFNQFIQQTIDYYKKRLPLEGQGRTLEFKAGEIPPVAISPELLSWAFENLIKNALQSVDSKSGRVEVRSFLSADGRGAVVEVSDNGPGIPSGAARKIFRPGFTTKKRGWGLGLSLVKRIVEESHGGKVFLKRSKPGETVFELNLPLG
ncbi:MAG: HAMP domain-containing histidine kinase [candidate division Zixibacteria bacterium]|nr:HAMP domain-containing histidine kinase [candidate division Zixibacteria bacterium]